MGKPAWCWQVDFNAKNDYEYINNYKILQAAFTKLGIDKVSSADFAAWQFLVRAQSCTGFQLVRVYSTLKSTS